MQNKVEIKIYLEVNVHPMALIQRVNEINGDDDAYSSSSWRIGKKFQWHGSEGEKEKKDDYMHKSWACAAILLMYVWKGMMMSRLATEYKHPTLCLFFGRAEHDDFLT